MQLTTMYGVLLADMCSATVKKSKDHHAGGKVTVVTTLLVDTDLIGSLSLRDVELVAVVAHSIWIRSGKGMLSGLENVFLSAAIV